MDRDSRLRLLCSGCVVIFFLLVAAGPAVFGQSTPPPDNSPTGIALYQALTKFELGGGTAHAVNIVLKRDRAEITFDGTFYFETPIDGHVRGAVFLGNGQVHANPPNNTFEQDNLRRMLHADAVDSDFKTAVLRFSDDTAEALGIPNAPGGNPPEEARKLASEFSLRLLRATGANLPARITVSILNNESPGVFLAEFDKGSRGHFGLTLDYQGRLPVAHFGLDAGEKGLFFKYGSGADPSEVWMAFFSLGDYQKQMAEYSDVHAVASVSRYDMDIDVRDWKHVKLETHMYMTAMTDGLRAIPLIINEDLSTVDDERLKKALRLKGARLADGRTLTAIQEDWDGTVTLLLPTPMSKGQIVEPILSFEGAFLMGDSADIVPAHYVRSDSWYPRTGEMSRSLFDITFRHKKGTRVAAIGQKVREEQAPDQDMVTEWRMDQPVGLATFAVGDFEVFTDKAKMETGGELNLDFYRVREFHGGYGFNVKPDFVLAEMNNSIRYFSALFGPYPYPRFGATYHPFAFGQGFPTMLMLPSSDQADKHTYSFIAHETSHQWWGDIVAWRSYRDQWLSEGFADYSGVLYTGLRDKNRNSPKDLLRDMHDELLNSPKTITGIGKGRLVDIGPIILGHRLNTRESGGAYAALIYNKGALVLRMLHFLFTDPPSGDDKAFFDMMKDFVSRYQNRAASTDDFLSVANEHFVSTPIARMYQLKDLNWFFQQWVYETALPSYKFTYSIEGQADGSAIVQCNLAQNDTPAEWMMPLPLVVHYGKDMIGKGTVFARGPESSFTLHLPALPESIELDPDRWVLSDKTLSDKATKKK